MGVMAMVIPVIYAGCIIIVRWNGLLSLLVCIIMDLFALMTVGMMVIFFLMMILFMMARIMAVLVIPMMLVPVRIVVMMMIWY